jgi:hypothetical protein
MKNAWINLFALPMAEPSQPYKNQTTLLMCNSTCLVLAANKPSTCSLHAWLILNMRTKNRPEYCFSLARKDDKYTVDSLQTFSVNQINHKHNRCKGEQLLYWPFSWCILRQLYWPANTTIIRKKMIHSNCAAPIWSGCSVPLELTNAGSISEICNSIQKQRKNQHTTKWYDIWIPSYHYPFFMQLGQSDELSLFHSRGNITEQSKGNLFSYYQPSTGTKTLHVMVRLPWTMNNSIQLFMWRGTGTITWTLILFVKEG